MRIPMATFDHPFLPNAGAPIRKMMLEAIGVASIEELYSDIPTQVRTNRSLKVDWIPLEQEVKSHFDRVLGENKSASDMPIFLGAGIYNHYLPAAVKAILARTEFQTSYTPYQAEISQGLLQSLFEFQSMIADITRMDAVNSSLYDGSTALGEAARMACRATGRRTILVPHDMHPSKFSVLKNYTEPVGIRLETFLFDTETGGLDLADLQSKIDRDTAAVYCEVPSEGGVVDSRLRPGISWRIETSRRVRSGYRDSRGSIDFHRDELRWTCSGNDRVSRGELDTPTTRAVDRYDHNPRRKGKGVQHGSSN